MKIEKDERVSTLDELREYLICKNIIIGSKKELMTVYSNMYKEGCFFVTSEDDIMSDVKDVLKDFADAYENNPDILEKDLIFYGAKKAVESIDKFKYSNNKIKK